jgi:short-subunit dehydrogenase
MTAPSAPRKTALITGASSGIGYELARIFAREGHDLVLVARNEEKLRALAAECQGVSARPLVKDLAQPTAPQEIFDELRQAGITVDVLVNNAGFGTYGPFVRSDLESQLDMIRVNVLALTHLSRLFLPGMILRDTGKLLNVASTAAFQPGPLMAVYYATKAYVLSFSEALSNELRGTGVTVSALCPGPTTSDFQRRARMERSRLVSGRMMDARTVAEIGYQGLQKNRPIIIPGFGNKMLAFSVRLTPRGVVRRIVRRLMESTDGG